MMRDGIDWRFHQGLTSYEEAQSLMEAEVEAIQRGDAPQAIWLMEHPPLLTAGHAAPSDLPPELTLPVLQQRRAGGLSYHGPGIRAIYPLLRVSDHARDVSCFVRGLEKWLIAALAEFNLGATLLPGKVGVYVLGTNPAQICSLAVRIRRGISLQGLALYVEPDLAILRATGISATSFIEQGYPVTFEDIDVALMRNFEHGMAGAKDSCTIL